VARATDLYTEAVLFGSAASVSTGGCDVHKPGIAPDTEAALRVQLEERSYDIHVGSGVLARAGELIQAATGSPIGFVITHPIVNRHHGEALGKGLGDLARQTILVPSGERQKSLRRAAALWDELLSRGADRRSVVVAFGGGVIGDLAGFVAATYMRGIPYVQVPTTLLAQVDSSVGGKVAINHPKGKNLVGAFYQPCLVLADATVLTTLRARDYRAGLAEVVKHAVIADAGMFDWLAQNARAAARREPSAVSYMVRRSCEIKADVVRRDEREAGLRAMLNFGHTVAHALESLGGYRAFRHGEAVSVGMAAAVRIAQRMRLLPAEEGQRVEGLLATLGLPTRISSVPVVDIVKAMRSDKKAVAGSPRFVLPRAIGAVDIEVAVDPAVLRRVLVELGAAL